MKKESYRDYHRLFKRTLQEKANIFSFFIGGRPCFLRMEHSRSAAETRIMRKKEAGWRTPTGFVS
jgi:hypothetical protein